MFLLDTNVLAELMRPAVHPGVAAWIGGLPPQQMFTTTISQAEILAGLAIMPSGRRHEVLRQAAEAMFAEDFAGRVLPFDASAATAYARLFAARRAAGRPAAMADLMIAAIARARGASVVTRDTGGFDLCGVPVLDPFTA